MKVGDFEFSLRELAGALGYRGTLFPLAIGYITIVGMNPPNCRMVSAWVVEPITGLALSHAPMREPPRDGRSW